MFYPRCCCVFEKVARRCGEELHDGLVLERRRVRHVDDDRRTLEGLGQSFAGERVDAGVWRRRHDLVAMAFQYGHELRSNQACAANDGVFHGRGPGVTCGPPFTCIAIEPSNTSLDMSAWTLAS